MHLDVTIQEAETYLSDCKIEHQSQGNRVNVICPYHPGASLGNAALYWKDDGWAGFKCQSCAAAQAVVVALKDISNAHNGTSRNLGVFVQDLAKRLGKSYTPAAPIDPMVVQRAVDGLQLPEAQPLVHELYKRAITPETITARRIGYSDGRLIIPVMDLTGKFFINLRKYLPGAATNKMLNLSGAGRSAPYPYPHDQFNYPTLMILGGELKALAAAQELNHYNIGCVSMTNGEAAWPDQYLDHIVGKPVFICMDIDEAGEQAARIIASQCYDLTDYVYIVTLPLDPVRFPKGDISDYLALGEKVYPVIADEHYTKRYSITAPQQAALGEQHTAKDYEVTPLAKASVPGNLGKPLQVDGLVIGATTERYAVFEQIEVRCNRDRKECKFCTVAKQKKKIFEVKLDAPLMLELFDAKENAVLDIYRKKVAGIPAKCKTHEIIGSKPRNAVVCAMGPVVGLEATSSASDEGRTYQSSVILYDHTPPEPNMELTLRGRSQASPKTQEVILIATSASPRRSDLDAYEFDMTEECKIFQAPGHETDIASLENKLAEIYQDLAANVTRIYGRSEMHAVIDLAFHSVLELQLDDLGENKNGVSGRIETLVIGDSAVGKSETYSKLQEHYKAGHLVDCGNLTQAGLIGGVQQVAGRQLVTWGVLPMHDKRLVCLEELAHQKNFDVMGALTNARSTGVVRQQKIASGEAHARVRLVVTSNSKSGRPIASHGTGAEAILELVGKPEDVRRFTLCMCVGKDELDLDIEEVRKNPPRVAPRYTSRLCSALLLWVWQRTAEHVVFSKPVRDLTYEWAKYLISKYEEDIPLIDRGSTVLKVARIAAAVAARTFSTDDGVRVIVQQRHVEWAATLLMRLYDSEVMGYDRYSERIQRKKQLRDEDVPEVTAAFGTLASPRVLVDFLRGESFVDIQQIINMGGASREVAGEFIGRLCRCYCLESYRNKYILNQSLRTFLNTGDIPEDVVRMKNNGVRQDY